MSRTDPGPARVEQPAPREAGPLVGLLLIGGLCLVALGLAEAVRHGATATVDQRVFLLFRRPGDPGQTIGPPWLKEAARDLTSLGSTVVLGLALCATLGYLLMARKRAAAVLVLAAVAGGQALIALLKALFVRARPDLVPDAPAVFTTSFPSAHAMMSAVTYLTLGTLIAQVQPGRHLRIYLLGLAVGLTMAIGVSRVYLGVHWPTDVLAGWCVGAAWALLCGAVARALQRRGRIEAPGPVPPAET